MFEHMEISESIYKGVVEPPHKIYTREDSKRAGLSRKRIGESALSNNYSDINKSSGKWRKGYVDHPKDRSKLTCIIHGPVNSSDKCKVLGEFGSRCAKLRPIKDHSQEPEMILFWKTAK